MRRIPSVFHVRSLLLATATAMTFSVLPAAAAIHVILDPGHGGHDRGAVRGSIRESEIALNVAQLLAEDLRQDPRFRVTMTREKDQSLTLKERAQIAHAAEGDLFISIHANASEDLRAYGVEFYFQNQLPPDEEALVVANRENIDSSEDDEDVEPSDRLTRSSDLHRILEDLHRNWRLTASSDFSKLLLESWKTEDPQRRRIRRIRQAPFYLVSRVKMPSVLVEVGFVSHPKEGPRLTDQVYQRQVASRLYEGLIKFKEVIDKDRLQRLQ